MIKPGIDNLIKWIQINGIQTWYISTTAQSGQDNTRIFVSNPEQTLETELERMRQVLELSDNNLLYICGKAKADSKVGNFMERWRNGGEDAAAAAIGNPQYTAQPSHGIGWISREELDEKINDAVSRERFSQEREQFNREREAFERERKEYQDSQNGLLALAVNKAAPFISGLFNGGQHIGVAGTPHPVTAQPIHAAVPAAEEQIAEEAAFTDEEAARIETLIEQYKAFDPDYLTVLDKFIGMAVSGKVISVGMIKLSYNDVKDFILKA